MVYPDVVVSSQTMDDFSKEEQSDYADLQRIYLENQLRLNEPLLDGMVLRRARRPPRIALWPALKKKLEQLHRHRLHGERYRLLQLLREYNKKKFGGTIPKDLLTPGLFATRRDENGHIDDEVQEIIEIDHDSNTNNNDNKVNEIIEIHDDDTSSADGDSDNKKEEEQKIMTRKQKQKQKQMMRKKKKRNNNTSSSTAARDGGGNNNNDVTEEKMSTITMINLTADTNFDSGNGGNGSGMNNNVHNSEEDPDWNSNCTAWSTIELEQFLQGVTKIRPESLLQELQYEISDHALCTRIAQDYVTTRTVEQVQGQYRKYKDNYNARNFVIRGIRKASYAKKVYYRNYLKELKGNKQQVLQIHNNNPKNPSANASNNAAVATCQRRGNSNTKSNGSEEDYNSNPNSNSKYTAWSQTEKEQFVQCIMRIRSDSQSHSDHEIYDQELFTRLAAEYGGTTKRTVAEIQRQFLKYQEDYRARNFVIRGIQNTPYAKQVYYHNYLKELKWNERQVLQIPNQNENNNNDTNDSNKDDDDTTRREEMDQDSTTANNTPIMPATTEEDGSNTPSSLVGICIGRSSTQELDARVRRLIQSSCLAPRPRPTEFDGDTTTTTTTIHGTNIDGWMSSNRLLPEPPQSPPNLPQQQSKKRSETTRSSSIANHAPTNKKTTATSMVQQQQQQQQPLGVLMGAATCTQPQRKRGPIRGKKRGPSRPSKPYKKREKIKWCNLPPCRDNETMEMIKKAAREHALYGKSKTKKRVPKIPLTAEQKRINRNKSVRHKAAREHALYGKSKTKKRVPKIPLTAEQKRINHNKSVRKPYRKKNNESNYKNKLRNTIQNSKNNNSFPHLASSVRAKKEGKHDENTNDSNDNNNDNGTKTKSAKGSTDTIEGLKPTSEFPSKLHYLLQRAEKSNQSEIISWLPSGTAFQVHKPTDFAEGMMLQCFDPQITKYESFQRQLYEFGFCRVNNATSLKNEYGAYYHKLFVQDKHELCHNMIRNRSSRRQITKNRIRAPSTAAVVPDPIMSTNNNIKRDDDDKTDAMDDAAVGTGTNEKRKLNHHSRVHLQRKKSKSSLENNDNNSTITNANDDNTNDGMHGDDDDDGSYITNNGGDDDEDDDDDADNDDDDDDNEESELNSGISNNHSLVITDEPMNKRSLQEQTQWDTIYERLVAYKKEHKTTSVPKTYEEDPPLGRWVQRQRKAYQNKKLSNDRINRLNLIVFVWDPFAAQWTEQYERLVAYKKQHKSTCVPDSYPADPPLAAWIHRQRTNNNTNSSHLTTERKEQLNSIGFIWDVRDALWTERYEQLVEYKNQYNSTCVPNKSKRYPELGSWVSKQRRNHNNTNGQKMMDDRISRLNKIGFVWKLK